MASVPPETHMGPVELTVSDLDRSLDYYRDSIGLSVLEEGGGTARLGSNGTELLRLVEVPGAGSGRGYTGLFHIALLLPERRDLARWLAHAARDRVALTGLSDHSVSEAIYMQDPDDHGIEIYADRPRETWEGEVGKRMTTQPLDVESLLGELDDPQSESFEGQPGGTRMGHVHFRVADIPATIQFFQGVLGMDLMATYGSEAAFLSAGGYHHHVGANTWESAGRPAPPEGTAALRQATIVFPDTAFRDEAVQRVVESGQEPEDTPAGPVVRDPSGNSLLLA
jgi:catechol 2,3-dioxygenase